MLTVLAGTDILAVRTKALTLQDQSIANGVPVERIEGLALTPDRLLGIIDQQSLFGLSATYIIDMPSENGLLTFLVEQAKSLVSAQHQIIIIEKALTAAVEKPLASAGATIQVFNKATTDKTYDPFAITAALAGRDKKALWLCLMAAMERGISSEETVGILWWQLKVLRIVSRTTNATEAGLSSFVYDKAKRAVTRFRPTELDNLAFRLLLEYQRARQGGNTLGERLEAWVFSI